MACLARGELEHLQPPGQVSLYMYILDNPHPSQDQQTHTEMQTPSQDTQTDYAMFDKLKRQLLPLLHSH